MHTFIQVSAQLEHFDFFFIFEPLCDPLMTFYNIAYDGNMFEIWQESYLVNIFQIGIFWDFAQFSLCSCWTTLEKIGGL